jgi:hypothetical protein
LKIEIKRQHDYGAILMSNRIKAGNVKLKRAYEAPSRDDGPRILVDRLWPRGVKKIDVALDQWLKDLAPSTELRKWFGHDPALARIPDSICRGSTSAW